MNTTLRTLTPALAVLLVACVEMESVEPTSAPVGAPPGAVSETSTAAGGSVAAAPAVAAQPRAMGNGLADFVRASRRNLHVQTGLALQSRGVFGALSDLEWVQPPRVDGPPPRELDVDGELFGGIGSANEAFTGAASLGDDVPNSQRCIDEDSYLCWSSIICWRCDSRGYTRRRQFCRDADLDGYPNHNERVELDTHAYYCGFLHLNWGSSRHGCLLDDYAVISPDLQYYESVPEWGTCLRPHDCRDDQPGINPGQPETPYDGWDQDCSGDDICFRDFDRDGHASSNGLPAGYAGYAPMVPGSSGNCNIGSGYLTIDYPRDDCQDDNPAVAQGFPEVCDGFDNDCDGDVDEGLGNFAGCDAPSDNAACMNGYRQCTPSGGLTQCSRGAIASYEFDTGSGTLVPDGSNSGADLTLYNGARHEMTVGVSGGSVYFDGVDDYGYRPDIAAWMNSPQLTFSIWVYPTRTAAAAPTEHYFAVADQGNAKWHLMLRREADGRAYLHVDSSVGTRTIASDATIPVDAWTHLAATMETNGNVRLYVNGVQQTATAAIGVLAATGSQYLGSLANGAFTPHPFRGYIDEFLILPVHLPADRIAELHSAREIPHRHVVREYCDGLDNDCQFGVDDPYGALEGDLADDPLDFDTCLDGVFRCADNKLSGGVRELGPRVFYDMDVVHAPDGATEVKNVAGRYDGSDGHGRRWGGAYQPGQRGNAFQVTSAATYLEIPNSAATSLTSREITVTAWVRPTAPNTAGVIVNKEGSYQMGYSATGRAMCAITTGMPAAWVIGDPIPNDGNFHHVACRYRRTVNDDGEVEVLVDGVPSAATRSQFGSVAASANPLLIGRRLGTGEPFLGLIDDVGVYATALTNAEVGLVMASGAGAVLAPGAAPGNNLELCDGADNNCNGSVDELFVFAQVGPGGTTTYRAVGQTCDGADSDFCADEGGVVACAANMWSSYCTDDPADHDVELCDNVDNDCDGVVDNGFGIGNSCAGGDSDTCVDGRIVCSDGAAICSGGAMAIYSFESAGAPATDYSGNGNAAVITDATRTSPGRNGVGALTLAGNATSSLRISRAVATRTDEFTFGAWVYPTTGGIQGAILSAIDAAGTNVLLVGSRDWLFVNGVSYPQTQPLPDDRWVHVGVTYGRGMFRLYHNGGLVFERAISASPLNALTSDIWVGQELDAGPVQPGCPDGCSTSAAEAFAGRVDDVVWYGHALSNAEMIDLALGVPFAVQNLERCDFRDNDCDNGVDTGFTTGGVCDGDDPDLCNTDARTMCERGGLATECGWGAAALIDFEEYALPFRWRDLSGSGNHAVQGAAVTTQTVAGDTYAVFDGTSNARVSIDADEAWRPTFTVAFWARTLDADAPDQTMVARFTQRVDNMLDMGVVCPTGRAFEINRSGYVYVNCQRMRVEGIRATLRSAGNPWTHITMVHDGLFFRFYVNGVQQQILYETDLGVWSATMAQRSTAYGDLEWLGQIWLGQHLTRPDSGFEEDYAFEGYLDDFAWFDYALTQAEVSSLMTGFPQDAVNEEICDGRDNDCDGLVNENLVRLCSTACGFGFETCGPSGVWADCTARGATGERCDPLDHDCVGGPYNGFPVGEACTVGLGDCAAPGGYACNAAGDGVVCVGTPGTPGVERCDARDRDCDGNPYNGFPVGQACTVGLGVCARPGVYGCTADGSGVQCNGTPGTGSAYELCDDIDHDCDGNPYTSADPAGPDFPSGPCTAGVGACERTGVWQCTSTSSAACSATPGTPGPIDICLNGIDDDCDGLVDETTASVNMTVTAVRIGDPTFDYSPSGPCDIRQGASPCAAVTFRVQNTSTVPLATATTGVQAYSVSTTSGRQNASPVVPITRTVAAGATETFTFCWTNVNPRTDVKVGVQLTGACVAGNAESADSDYDLGPCGTEICDGFDNNGDGRIDELPEACGGRRTQVCVHDPALGGYYCVETLDGESCELTGCPVGQTCQEDACVEGCVSDDQCGANARCVDNACVSREDVTALDTDAEDTDAGSAFDDVGNAQAADDPGRSGCGTARGAASGSLLGLLFGLALIRRRRR